MREEGNLKKKSQNKYMFMDISQDSNIRGKKNVISNYLIYCTSLPCL